MPVKISSHQWKWISVAWLILTTVLLVMPGSAFPKSSLFKSIPEFDKLVHIFLFAVLTALFLKALQPSKLLGLLLLILVVILYGVFTEYLQMYLTTSRSFDERDIIADAIGAILGWGLYKLLNKIS
jgi:VanZ family protein